MLQKYWFWTAITNITFTWKSGLTNVKMHMIRVSFEFSNLISSMIIFVYSIYIGAVNFCHFSNNCLSWTEIRRPSGTIKNRFCSPKNGTHYNFHLMGDGCIHSRGKWKMIYDKLHIMLLIMYCSTFVFNFKIPILANGSLNPSSRKSCFPLRNSSNLALIGTLGL